MPAPARTQAKARAAPAGGLRAHTPEKSHRSLPQALTAASRKSSPQFPKTLTGRSRTSSPTHPANAHRPFPGKAHRGFPQGLTGNSREGSPDAPESAHLTAPGKAHLPLPKSLTFVPFRMEQVRNARVVRRNMAPGPAICGGQRACHRLLRTPQVEALTPSSRSRSERRTDPHIEGQRVERSAFRTTIDACDRDRASPTSCIPRRLRTIPSEVRARSSSRLRLQLHPESHHTGFLGRRHLETA